jgi:spore coat polysaccharide biosynthesis protein SpsF
MSARPVMAVMQARLASTRLPAKALLPIGGMPSLLLSARRAANTGLNVSVATSTEAPDDAIAAVVAKAGIACFRGSHLDVLGRFVDATARLPDEGIVVRLTADNVFPDGAFVDDLIEAFIRQDLEYLGSDSPRDGLPYGLSAEVFTVGALRRAGNAARASADREHVTPWIRRHARSGMHTRADVDPSWSRLRCTLDTFEDYNTLLRVFAEVEEPIATPWKALVARLAANSTNRLGPRCPFVVDSTGQLRSVLTLGTAQLGMPYGIANTFGRPDDAEAASLLELAVDAGITSIDTARAYGDAEERIGRLLPAGHRNRLEIVTKLDVLAHLSDKDGRQSVRSAVEASVLRSARALRTGRIDVVLLHRWQHRHAWNAAAWGALLDLRREGVIGRLGASVANPTEAIEALGDADVTHLQCPVNLLDARWRTSAFAAAVSARQDVVVHGRSVLLQGLLTMPAPDWIDVPGVDPTRLCRILDDLVARLGRADRTDLCIAYVRSLPWVTSVVLGMDSSEQLLRNLAAVQRRPLSFDERAHVDSAIPDLPESLLNPALWRIAA